MARVGTDGRRGRFLPVPSKIGAKVKMDFLAGMLFGVGVTGIGFILLASRSLNAMTDRMAALEYAVQSRPGRNPLDDADWWKDGRPRHEEDEFD